MCQNSGWSPRPYINSYDTLLTRLYLVQCCELFGDARQTISSCNVPRDAVFDVTTLLSCKIINISKNVGSFSKAAKRRFTARQKLEPRPQQRMRTDEQKDFSTVHVNRHASHYRHQNCSKPSLSSLEQHNMQTRPLCMYIGKTRVRNVYETCKKRLYAYPL